MDDEQIVRDQRVAYRATVHGGCLMMFKRLLRREVPLSAHLRTVLGYRGQEDRSLIGDDRCAMLPELTGRGAVPAVGQSQLVG